MMYCDDEFESFGGNPHTYLLRHLLYYLGKHQTPKQISKEAMNLSRYLSDQAVIYDNKITKQQFSNQGTEGKHH